MRIANWLQRLVSRINTRRGNRTHSRRPAAVCQKFDIGRLAERLEERCVLTVSPAFAVDTLTITFGAASDQAYISYDGTNYDVGTTEGANDLYNGTDAVTKIVVVDGGAFASQTATFSGLNAFPGTLTNLTVAGIETSEVTRALAAATVVSGNASVVNITAPGTLPDGLDLVAASGTVNLGSGTFTHSGQLDINKAVSIIGAGQDSTIIKRSGEATGTEDRAVSINTANATFQSLTLGGWDTVPSNANVGNGYLAWLNDVAGNNAVGDADNATFDDVRFDANDNRVAIYVGTVDGLTVTDSRFTGTLFRAGIRGAGEDMLISHNTFEESHYWYSPIYFEYGAATSGEISYNYFANRVGVNNQVYGNFKSDGTGLYAITNYQPNTITGAGLLIEHNTFHFQDSDLVNDNGSKPQPVAVYNDPAITASGPITIRDNVFQGYEYTGAQPSNSEPTWQPTARSAPHDGALTFDGIKTHGVFQSSLFDIGAKGTISVWINPTDVGTVRHSVINGGGLEVTVRNGSVYFYPDSGETTATLTYAAANSIAANTWTHLALTWDFASKTTRIYVNGVETVYQTGGGLGTGSSHPTWVSAGTPNNQPIHIGRDRANPDRFFPGQMDDVGFFNDVLTPAEIASVMTNGVETLIADSRLVADWNFDQSSGAVAEDAKNSVDLHLSTTGLLPSTFTAPAFVPGGQISGALQFDSTKENFGTFKDSSFDIASSGTLSLWVKPTDVGTIRHQILDGGGMGFTIRNGATYFYTVSGNDNTLTYAANNSFPANTWTHLAYTWDFATKTTHIYINGVEATYQGGFGSSRPLWGTVSNTVDQLMTLGRDPNTAGREFPGLMDDIGVFNQALSLAEVTSVKNSGVATLVGDPRLVTHWNFDDVAGTTVVPGDSGTDITLYLQQQPPAPGIQGYAINSSPNTTATNNLFYQNDANFNASVTDGGNLEGNPVFKLSGAVPDPFYQIGFGSLAAYASTAYQLDDTTTSPHIGAYQGPPGLLELAI